MDLRLPGEDFLLMRLLLHDYAGHPFQVQLSRELARRGHEVIHAYAGRLLTPRGALTRREGDAAGFSLCEVPMSPAYRDDKYSFLKRRGHEVVYGTELTALVRRSKADAIISGNTPTEPQWAMVQAARQAGVPFFTWLQDFYSLAVDKLARKKLPLIGAMAGAWYRHLDAKCLQASAGVVAITDDFVPILQQFGVPPEKVTVIENWAPLDELPLRPRRNEWSARHGMDDKFVFLYSGTLAMKHNPDLLRRLAEHFKDDSDIRVVVISEGPGADFLREHKADGKLANLEMLPFQSFGEMPEVLASADVLVTVLEADAGVFSVPSKVLTYLTAGRAILGAMPAENLATRIIRREGCGLCALPQDAPGFLAAASELRRDNVRRGIMAGKARAYAVSAFDITRIADRFENLIAASHAAKR